MTEKGNRGKRQSGEIAQVDDSPLLKTKRLHGLILGHFRGVGLPHYEGASRC
jgi:hypothetical protein